MSVKYITTSGEDPLVYCEAAVDGAGKWDEAFDLLIAGLDEVKNHLDEMPK